MANGLQGSDACLANEDDERMRSHARRRFPDGSNSMAVRSLARVARDGGRLWRRCAGGGVARDGGGRRARGHGGDCVRRRFDRRAQGPPPASPPRGLRDVHRDEPRLARHDAGPGRGDREDPGGHAREDAACARRREEPDADPRRRGGRGVHRCGEGRRGPRPGDVRLRRRPRRGRRFAQSPSCHLDPTRAPRARGQGPGPSRGLAQCELGGRLGCPWEGAARGAAGGSRKDPHAHARSGPDDSREPAVREDRTQAIRLERRRIEPACLPRPRS